MPNANWHLYLLRTRMDTLYTGIATDVERRIHEHESVSGRGAKYLRAKGPLQLAYQACVGSREIALMAEHRIKQLSRQQKEQLIADNLPGPKLLGKLGLD